MANIQDTIKQAQEAAGEIVDAEIVQEQLPATQSSYQAPASYKKPSMETLGQSQGIAKKVKNWLKVNKFGLTMNKDRAIHADIEFTIDMTQDEGFFLKESIKWGKPTKYASTYDGGATSDKGGAFSDHIARAEYETGKEVKPFPSADLLLKTTKAIKIGDTTLEAGTLVGHTLSMSNWDDWVEFFRDVNSAGLAGTEVAVKISSEEVIHNGFNWGIIKMKLKQ